MHASLQNDLIQVELFLDVEKEVVGGKLVGDEE